MPRRSRLSIAKSKIEGLFNHSDFSIFSRRDLELILFENRKEWQLLQSTSFAEFLRYLESRSKLTRIELIFPAKIVNRYIWGEEKPGLLYEMGLSLGSNSYLSHYTAVFLHDLTEQVPKKLYVNIEQGEKGSEGNLAQEAIDRAFEKPARQTSNIASFQDYKIALLNGKYTNELGVMDLQVEGVAVRLTDIERTLIDIAVRPEYAGGVYEVLKAFTLAKGKVSVNKIKAYLSKIDYIYPYHQVLGFYLEKAGFPENRLKLLEKDIHFDFYLSHGMENPTYSNRWRLYYPKEFDDNQE